MEFEKIFKLVHSLNENINVYIDNDVIIIDGLVKKEGKKKFMYKLTDLASPKWDDIPDHILVSFKNFAILLNNNDSEKFTQELIKKFNRTSIIHCELIKIEYFRIEGDDEIYKKTKWCGYGCGYLPISINF